MFHQGWVVAALEAFTLAEILVVEAFLLYHLIRFLFFRN
jgi:hypothetical protein